MHAGSPQRPASSRGWIGFALVGSLAVLLLAFGLVGNHVKSSPMAQRVPMPGGQVDVGSSNDPDVEEVGKYVVSTIAREQLSRYKMYFGSLSVDNKIGVVPSAESARPEVRPLGLCKQASGGFARSFPATRIPLTLTPLNDTIAVLCADCARPENAPDLKFVRVVSATKQVVAGLMWRLTVEVKTPVGPAEYKATVYQPPGPDATR